MSENKEKKLKKKAVMYYGAKKRLTNVTALKLFAWQVAEKSQLEERKADLLQNLTNKIA